MKVGLALGGGGARGFAHIGVLRALEERGIDVVAVSGCSMGGIVGAFVANGVGSKDIRSAFLDVKAISLLDWSSKGGLIGGKGLEKQIEKYLPARFDQLHLPFKTVAVDIRAGRLCVFSEGDLALALRATSAMAGIFSPVEHDGKLLVDGGLLSSVPIEEVRSMTTHPIVAVDVTVPPDRPLAVADNLGFLEKLRMALKPGTRPLIIELLLKAYEIPSAVLNDIRMAGLRPDMLIRPLLDSDLKLEEFGRMDEAIEMGYQETIAMFDARDIGA